ncbi:hypothetical protein GLOTRDRAFT_44190 [Gloeophyllum trabeum ATCC 11539]|uniref:Uncharacterized protein n=1 Tax=Gloeophyllum trabeum (strain ATCC 11539 / FP-39264 / Madison 617) TaxID=670483 RepID=S7Q422_GLOTA|nr:uncharacterized protein GLOTRDRAFT_44190 [Gloeophyllum trabeum ATCC 11539]EPQ54272.1 hypothetical protein GLOTRDRAFT_44190 [Gloeophyllum trabeum ATCC 11539]
MRRTRSESRRGWSVATNAEGAVRTYALHTCSNPFISGPLGHPSCMQLDEISENIHLYPWKCMECKNCEICQEKGDDVR